MIGWGEFWTDPYHWFFDAGVPANLVASIICFVAAGVTGYFRVWKKHMRPHIERTHQIHRHLDPNDSYEIGSDA